MKHEERRIIKHTPSNLFKLVSDVKKYPEFLPWCLGARVKNNRKNNKPTNDKTNNKHIKPIKILHNSIL